MLILTRAARESIELTVSAEALAQWLRENPGAELEIEVIVHDVVHGRARIGIQAPRMVTIDRSEVARRKRQQAIAREEISGNV